MKYVSTSLIALSLLAAAPIAALAEDSGTSVSGDATVQTGNPGSFGSGDVRLRIFPPMRPLGATTSLQFQHRGEGRDGMQEGDASSSERVIQGGGLPMGMNKFHATSSEDMGRGDNGKHLDLGANNGEKVRAKGTAEIDARIAKLTAMIQRVSQAERLSDEEKTSLTTILTDQITQLTALKTNIGTEGTTTLKGDVSSITKAYRTYALVLPQAAITASADRIMTVVSTMDAFSAKISARIDAAASAGADVTAARTAYSDYTAKIADAKTQAQAAASEVAGLKADNGDKTILASNTAALKDAKTKLDTAQQDLKDARKDIGTILSAIKGKGEHVEVHATTTAETR